MTDNFTVLQHNYGVIVAVLTVNWEFFADIAAASFDAFSATSTAWSLVLTVYTFLFVAIAGAITTYVIIVARPRRLLETLRIFHVL